MKLYGDSRSGNCYKLKLTCSLLNITHDWVHVDILAGATREACFRALNPNGRIPVLQLSDGSTLWESNAILNYLARDSRLLPEDPLAFARVLQWQFFEQYSHEPYIAVARFIALYQGMPEDRRAEYAEKQVGGHRALSVMESRLEQSDFLVGNSLTTADIALYAYTHVADEGGFNLADYDAVRRWLVRVESEPGYCPMQ
jgi:glutathione S-transferase